MPRLFRALLLLLGLSSAQAGWKELGTLPGRGEAWQYDTELNGRPVRLTGVSFPATAATFRVLDNPPSDRRSLEDALTRVGGIAGVNGGYFHPDFTPLGLVVADGKVLHPAEKARLLSGFLTVRNGRIQLVRAGDFKMGSDLEEALQAGPWLVENGEPMIGLNAEKLARRTLVCTNGKGAWALISISPVTLANAAALLTQKDFSQHLAISGALNLDGGSSTLMLAGKATRALVDIPSFGVVANYLAIVPRAR